MIVPEMNDGVYSAAARGFLGDVPVKVVVEDGKIVNIEVLPNQETPDFAYYPSFKIPGIIKEYQTLGVDILSGATFTSRAIINAVADCVRQADGDVKAMKRNPGPRHDCTEVIGKECDVCVLGTGGAGSCAAAAAAEQGARVIVLEKAGYNGGVSSAANCFLAVGSKIQLEAGVDLHIEDVYNHMMLWNHYYGNGRLISKYLHKTASTVEWLAEKGVEMEYRGCEQYTDPFECPVHFKGFRDRSVRRNQLRQILESILQYGGEVLYEHRAQTLLKDGDQVVGVKAVREDGATVIVRAKAVIIATGCYDGNKELAEQYFHNKARFCMPKWLAEGDGLLMCLETGADKYHLGARVLHLSRPERALSAKAGFPFDDRCVTVNQMAAFPAAMMMNYKGQRYVNEWLIHNSAGCANMNAAQGNNGDFLIFFDQGMVDTLVRDGAHALGVHVVPGGFTRPFLEPGFFNKMNEELETAVNLDMCVKGETIAELAEKLKINPAMMEYEVGRYNEFCHSGYDEDFFKDPELLHALEKGPYYVMRCTSESLGSCGGVRIDDEMRVLTPKRDVITGLYCAGACAGGIWGNDSYGILEGSTCSWAYNSGRMAGESATKYVLGIE